MSRIDSDSVVVVVIGCSQGDPEQHRNERKDKSHDGSPLVSLVETTKAHTLIRCRPVVSQ